MESYGTIEERSAATPKLGRRIIAAVAAVALVVGASASLSFGRIPGANLITTLTPDADAVDFVMCTMQWDPVCADGKTYGNPCQAKGAGVMTFSQGECEDVQAQTTPCTREFAPVCGSNAVEYVNKCYADNANVTYTDGPCTKPCTRELRPVCGSDGVQYDNACLAGNAGVAYTEGPCVVDTPHLIPCPRIYRPVCCGGVTYANACVAGERLCDDGACSTPVRPGGYDEHEDQDGDEPEDQSEGD
jgi:hypothetical protein